MMGEFFGRIKQQKRAYVALMVAVLMALVALFAPFIANDKPLILVYQKSIYLPMLVDYPETTFGGVFETPTDYKDPAIQTLINKNGMMVMPPIVYGENTLVLNPPTPHPSAPTWDNVWGTDALGRDVFARTLYGLRLSLGFGLALTLIASLVGLAVGSVLGYFGGWVDLLGQRVIEIWLGLPQLFILMILMSVFRPSVLVVFVGMLLFVWLPLVSVARVHVYRLRQAPFVLTAKNLGVSPHRIIIRHFLPSLIRLSLAQFPFILVGNIVILTALDFLGFGLPMESASLGELLYQGSRHLDAPHLAMAGVSVLMVILMALIIIGESFRQALDVGK